ncbi:hypothetical protein [Actinoplanes italicus]|nr:hypothetical protein [Actinoplanes italicus]
MIKKQQGIILYGHEADAVAAALSQLGSRRRTARPATWTWCCRAAICGC